MTMTNSIASGAAALWSTFHAVVKAGISTGALQAILGAVIAATKGDAKEHSLRKNCAMAVADIVEYQPESDNIEALTSAIARLTYVLEQELKAKKERAHETQSTN